MTNYKHSPLFSIITVVKNNLPGLKKTVESVISQSYQNYELIIMDGGLSAEIKFYIESLNSHRIKLFQMIDAGIYDAMNRGFDFSNGYLINFLNTDDCYSHKYVLDDLSKISTDYNKSFIIKGLAETSKGILRERLTYLSLLRYTPNHQSVFYNRNCFHKYIFNKNLKLAADWAHFYEINNSVDKFYLDKVIINYKDGGVADRKESHEITWRERLFHLLFISDKSFFYKFPHIFTSLIGILYSKFKLMRW